MESLQKLGYEGFCLAGNESSVLKGATPKANVFLEKCESTLVPEFCSFLGSFYSFMYFFELFNRNDLKISVHLVRFLS